MSCEYCKGEKDLHSLRENLSYKGDFYPGIHIVVDDWALHITCIPDVYEPGFEEAEVPIKFCPMCGEKLKEK